MEDEIVGWHQWLRGHEFEQALRDGEGQGSLACCSPWGSQKVGYDLATEQQTNLCKKIFIGSVVLANRWSKDLNNNI